MTPEEAKAKIESLVSSISYEQNLQRRLRDRKEFSAIKISEKLEKDYYQEIEELRIYL